MLGVTDQRQRPAVVSDDDEPRLSATERVLVLSTTLAGLGTQPAISPQGWLAAFAATMVSDLVGTAAVTLSMSLQEGEFQRSVFRQLLSVQTVATLANTCLALVAAAVLWQDVRAAWL